jgi:hypothetical protein
VTGVCRGLHNEKLHSFYSSSSIIRMMKWAGHVALMRVKEESCRILVEARKKKTSRKNKV